MERIAREAYEAGKAAGDLPGKVWNAKEAVAFLGVSPGTVYTIAANGEIPCRKIGDRYIFHPAALNEWAANCGLYAARRVGEGVRASRVSRIFHLHNKRHEQANKN